MTTRQAGEADMLEPEKSFQSSCSEGESPPDEVSRRSEPKCRPAGGTEVGGQSEGKHYRMEAGPGGPAVESPAPAAGDSSELEQEIESLRAELATWKEKAEVNWDQFLRARADLDNYRKRVERDIAFRVRLGKRDLILGLLEVLDNLERVTDASKAAGKGTPAGNEDSGECDAAAGPGEDRSRLSSLIAGVEMVKRQMEAVLQREGVLPVECLGRPFDPALHEAVEVVEGAGESGTVVEVLLQGYTYEGDLLRAARVKVAK